MRSLIACTFAMLVFSIVGCASVQQIPQGPRDISDASTEQTVAVAVGDIESVVVVAGEVVANPSFVLSAPATGLLSLDPDVPEQVSAGESIGTISDNQIIATHPIRIDHWFSTNGQLLAKHSPIVQGTYSGFGIALSVPPDSLYRIYDAPIFARTNIESGPGGIECALVPTDPVDGGLQEGPNLPVLCLLPMDTEVVAGLPAQIGLVTGKVQDALLLPITSVLGAAGEGRVSRIDEAGNLEEVTIQLGVSDGVNIEVLSGLTEGDRVTASAPKLF